jgi:hypothetical protein
MHPWMGPKCRKSVETYPWLPTQESSAMPTHLGTTRCCIVPQLSSAAMFPAASAVCARRHGAACLHGRPFCRAARKAGWPDNSYLLGHEAQRPWRHRVPIQSDFASCAVGNPAVAQLLYLPRLDACEFYCAADDCYPPEAPVPIVHDLGAFLAAYRAQGSAARVAGCCPRVECAAGFSLWPAAAIRPTARSSTATTTSRDAASFPHES